MVFSHLSITRSGRYSAVIAAVAAPTQPGAAQSARHRCFPLERVQPVSIRAVFELRLWKYAGGTRYALQNHKHAKQFRIVYGHPTPMLHRSYHVRLEFVDGMLVLFRHNPGLKNKDENSDFFNHRKHRHGFQATTTADDMHRIIFSNSQWPSSANDARAITSLAMLNSPEEHPSGGEYLLGDSAYPCSQRLICPLTCRGRGNSRLSQHHPIFNRCLSDMRIIIEHTIGILKARLRSLPIRINNNEAIREASSWVGGLCGASQYSFA